VVLDLSLLRRRGAAGTEEVTTEAAAPAFAPVLTRPQLIARLVADARAAGLRWASTVEAEEIIALWARARVDADGPPRPKGRRTETLLTRDELRRDGPHTIMDHLMVDEKPAQAGTVHDELDRFTFGVDPVTGRAVRGVIHTMDSFDRCAVCVAVVPAA
jgi:hypothetical protein